MRTHHEVEHDASAVSKHDQVDGRHGQQCASGKVHGHKLQRWAS